MTINEEILQVKITPFGKINIYGSEDAGYTFVLTEDVFELAKVYAKKNNWTQNETDGIGGTFPF